MAEMLVLAYHSLVIVDMQSSSCDSKMSMFDSYSSSSS